MQSMKISIQHIAVPPYKDAADNRKRHAICFRKGRDSFAW
jgi:hypothetical protein